jgi:Flp pilus assembly protein TadG
MTTLTTKSRRGRRGSAMIEATLTLSLFLTVLFSLYDFGWVLFFEQTLVHQARTAARYGAVNPGNLTTIQNVAVYSATTGSGTGLFGLEPANVLVSRSGQGTTADRITVTITGYQYTVITMGWAGSYNGKDITVSIPVEN